VTEPGSAGALGVVLVDDAALFRDLLAEVLRLQAGADVTAVSDPAGLLETVRTERPDVCIIDIRLPPTFTVEGLLAARDIRRQHPDIGLLLLSQHLEVHHLARLLQPAGATGGGFGYLLKERVTGIAGFLDAVKRVAAGEIVMDPLVVGELLQSVKCWPWWPKDCRTSRSAAGCGCPARPWKPTSVPSSTDSTCPRRSPATVGCWPS